MLELALHREPIQGSSTSGSCNRSKGASRGISRVSRSVPVPFLFKRIAQVFLSDEQVLVQTPDIPRLFLVEPEHRAALRLSLTGNGRSRRKVWLEQQRERQKASNETSAEISALDDVEGGQEDKKGAASVRRAKESLALEFLQRKEKNKLADPNAESNVNSAAAVVDSSTLHELEAMQEELAQFKTMFSDLLVSPQPDAALSSRVAASAQPMSIMQREKTISQREKRLVSLQKNFLLMQDTIERAVAADEQRQSEFDSIKAEVSIVQRAIDTPGTIAKAADIANKRRRAQAMMAKALKLNRKHQAVAEKLPANEAIVKQKHEQLMSQVMALQTEYEQISRDIKEVETHHEDIERALDACESRSASTLLQYGPRLPRAAALPDVALFPIAPLKEELELLYERQVLSYRTRVAESKLEELSAVWERLEELKEDERCDHAKRAGSQARCTIIHFGPFQVGGHEAIQANVPCRQQQVSWK